eukprot:CAMPEP_0118690630 /NCGR_PEP_ID=MMETSP0800-20121206/10226_1 /TAXON_ID=210618 ORGANISM="Striatella unipunctata, Strain CCMP2910" /NCGR_SAMPLE_ID=MMETSP0800 /ASSEMBLY_ACC=CAM_ASM_000638 /LENGTH=157 /DNA_ID=CAMNT_0006588309 /DNA_START=28 /DNA_END=501 /DNA_ORIENTATION=-
MTTSKDTTISKQERRRASNRQSARKSRYRQVVLVDELTKCAEELSKENELLKQEQESLRFHIRILEETRRQQLLLGRQKRVEKPFICNGNLLTEGRIPPVVSIVHQPRTNGQLTPSPLSSPFFKNDPNEMIPSLTYFPDTFDKKQQQQQQQQLSDTS